VAAQREDGIGNFGETYPASVEPSLRATLFAGISGIVVRITVDESGRATSIEFVRPPADAAQREELRTRLLAAHFIPANCNGLRCTGTVELKN
jgi:multidrug efflux pump subunit AcrA (membrane-fusion protein)